MNQKHFEAVKMFDRTVAKKIAKLIKHHGYIEPSYNRTAEAKSYDEFRIVVWHESLKDKVNELAKLTFDWVEKDLNELNKD